MSWLASLEPDESRWLELLELKESRVDGWQLSMPWLNSLKPGGFLVYCSHLSCVGQYRSACFYWPSVCLIDYFETLLYVP